MKGQRIVEQCPMEFVVLWCAGRQVPLSQHVTTTVRLCTKHTHTKRYVFDIFSSNSVHIVLYQDETYPSVLPLLSECFEEHWSNISIWSSFLNTTLMLFTGVPIEASL